MMLRLNRVLEWWARWERPLSTISLVVGFSFDLIVAKRPDSVFDNLLLLFYLTLSAACIVMLNRRTPSSARAAESEAPLSAAPEPLLLLLILQFCFGGLSSNLLVLYGKSGTPAGDLIFTGLLFCMLVGNEFLRTRYEQLRFNIAVWYLLLLTYCIIAVPTFLLHAIGWQVFLISGGASLIVAALYLFLLSRVAPLLRGRTARRRLWGSSAIVGGIFLFFTALYFGGVIPPVPLSLKSIGIYHSVTKDAPDSYLATYEAAPWWEFWKDTSSVYTLESDNRAYCFSSVFAPTALATPVRHVWEYFDPVVSQWETRAQVDFAISGGRADGYRGFSIKSNLVPGLWRCEVETPSGQLIGQMQFKVVAASSTPTLQSTVL